MKNLFTPFGEICIRIDGTAVPYIAEPGKKDRKLWPNVLGRYRIQTDFKPDGEKHDLSCTFDDEGIYRDSDIRRDYEGGRNLECQAFYNSMNYKMSLGVECKSKYLDGNRISSFNDFDVKFLENGLSCIITEHTKTESYVFRIAWIDKVDADDLAGSGHNRGVETWFAVDPSMSI